MLHDRRRNPPLLAAPLLACLLPAAAAALARDAAGHLLINPWLAALLQAPVLALWLRRVAQPLSTLDTDAVSRASAVSVAQPPSAVKVAAAPRGGRESPAQPIAPSTAHSYERGLTLALLLAATAVALLRRSPNAFFLCTTIFIGGQLLIDAACAQYRRIAAALDEPTQLLRSIIPAWLWVTATGAILLTLPLAMRSAVPDYRHNFWNHALAAASDAVATACLIGPSIYSFAEDYSHFGQVVVLLLTQAVGLIFAAIGLAIFARLAGRAIRLAPFLRLLCAVQAVGALVLWLAGPRRGEIDSVQHLWHSLALATSALWNTSLQPTAGGLARDLANPWLFCVLTTLAMLGSIGLPVVWMLVVPERHRGSAPAGSGKAMPTKPGAAVLHSLPQAEAGAAFLILAVSAGLIFLFETPRFLPDRLVPTRPVDLGSSQAPIRDESHHGNRWRLAVFTAVTLRSTGLQSFPVAEGALAWPSVALFLLMMGIGGSVAGVAGGMRTTSLIAPCLALLRPRATRTTTRRLVFEPMLWLAFWLLFNAFAVALLYLTTQATPYEITFDAVAATNSVALSTGLIPHLPWPARLVVTAIMILGRWLPIVFWSRAARGLPPCPDAAPRAA